MNANKETQKEYERQFMGEFKMDPFDKTALEIAEKYHTLTEEFDKRVCSATRNGVPMPVSIEEHRLINRNAINIRSMLAREYEIEENTLMKYIKYATEKYGLTR